MGRLRSALRALALTGAGPVEVLTGLDVFAATTPGATMATLLYGEVDEVARTFRYSCTGHCPPLVVELGGSSRYLEDGRSVPLGIPDFEFERIEATAELPAGSTLLLYSDGLIERRGEPLDAGLRRLAGAAVESKAGDAEELADELLTAMLEGQSQTDDVALLCVVFPRPTTPFVRRLPARPEELSELRRAMRTWLEEGRRRRERDR